jgi:ribosomal protein L11 methyltransferase
MAALDTFGESVSAFAHGGSAYRIEILGSERPDEANITIAVALAAASAGILAPRVSVTPLAPRDWIAENQRSFPPFSIGRYFIRGSDFDGCAPEGAIELRLDAGAAFGTGRHASTAGCLLAIERLATHRRVRSALDLGCGSAILAIAIAKTWGARVLAADIDELALSVARDNIRTNGVAKRVGTLTSRGFDAAEIRRAPPFDLIVANIQLDPLVAMAADFARHAQSGGAVVLSGILETEGPSLIRAFACPGLVLGEVIHVETWLTLIFDRSCRPDGTARMPSRRRQGVRQPV